MTKRDLEDIEEIVDRLSVNGELKFIWRGEEYIIQPDRTKLYFYNSTPPLRDLCVVSFKGRGAVGADLARRMLNEKVLDGKSLIERWDEIKIIHIF